jgi:hypothetical protein
MDNFTMKHSLRLLHASRECCQSYSSLVRFFDIRGMTSEENVSFRKQPNCHGCIVDEYLNGSLIIIIKVQI